MSKYYQNLKEIVRKSHTINIKSVILLVSITFG